MKLLIDTNVILDIFLKREPFFPDSYAAMRKALENEDRCFISAAAATDIFYILRKHLKSAAEAKARVRDLTQVADFVDVQTIDVTNALDSVMDDFEDAVVDSVACRIGAVYILTRNIKDFLQSRCQAITPSDFLRI